MPTHGFFITGTDTGVGKTLITCALLHALAARGRRVVGMKPVAAGAAATVEGLLNDDVRLLREASNVQAPLALINPYCFAAPVAPHLAAEQAGITIDLANIESAFLQLRARAESIIVEGVGGFCVPLNRSEDGADLARRLQLPVLMVVGVRLGCLNHALLTLKAINDEGLVLTAPVPEVYTEHFGPSGIDYVVRYWLDDFAATLFDHFTRVGDAVDHDVEEKARRVPGLSAGYE